MAHWAKPGVKCVCIDAGDHDVGRPSPLVLGSVYTICSLVNWPRDKTSGRLGWSQFGLVLEEVRNPYAWIDGAFAVERFRPIVTRTQEQDLEHFTPLLNSVEEPA